MECDKKPLTTIKTELVGVDGKPFTITQRKLRCLEERDATDLSGYRSGSWDAERIRRYLDKVGKDSLDKLTDAEYEDCERYARTPGDSADSPAGFKLFLYRVCFSMGGRVEGSKGGGKLLGEGWSLEAEITPDALADVLTTGQLLQLANNASRLTVLTEDEEKKLAGPSSTT